MESMILLSYENENLTQRDNDTINSLLKQRVDNFLNFFTTRRLDEEFSFKFNGELKMLQSAKVILNGLDDKIYDVSDEFETSSISSYHKHYKEGNLYKIFSIKGMIQVNLVSEKLKKIVNQDSYET